VDEAVPLTKRKRIYGQPIDVSTAMIRLFGGEVLDIPSQDFNLTSGSYMQEDDTNLKIVTGTVGGPRSSVDFKFS
jgi:hypothetical protein